MELNLFILVDSGGGEVGSGRILTGISGDVSRRCKNRKGPAHGVKEVATVERCGTGSLVSSKRTGLASNTMPDRTAQKSETKRFVAARDLAGRASKLLSIRHMQRA
ncbi:hypothetical protein GCM10008955_29020 [Deinococcus malanensis]|uniref:Uncharacterized protein n=1 Tax=Deinococcus malanensis TaxID=1706855 RepID=A0ABQ2EZM4_9DEIO|nr:hypothetical protein GCM10008955_29020 [Deinococcus malanensis]